MKDRLDRVRRLLSQQQLDGIIVSKRHNICYLTGLEQIHPTHREALLFISSETAVLYHSSFLSPTPLPHFQLEVMQKTDYLQKLLQKIYQNSSNVGIEPHDLTVAEHTRFSQLVPTITLSPTNQLIETIRLIKSPTELDLIKQAGNITAATMKWAQSYVSRFKHKQITEQILADKINQKIKQLGAQGNAFPTIVAVDKNSALPHHQPGGDPITPESIVLLDFGARVDNYCADMSRTIKLGKDNKQFSQVEHTVKTAYQQALNVLQPGNQAAQVDMAARSYIKSQGFGPNFTHTTGHGLGLEIHEQPSLNQANHQELKEGMTVTIEPGIYLPNQFGYRHEDTVHLSSSESTILTTK